MYSWVLLSFGFKQFKQVLTLKFVFIIISWIILSDTYIYTIWLLELQIMRHYNLPVFIFKDTCRGLYYFGWIKRWKLCFNTTSNTFWDSIWFHRLLILLLHDVVQIMSKSRIIDIYAVYMRGWPLQNAWDVMQVLGIEGRYRHVSMLRHGLLHFQQGGGISIKTLIVAVIRLTEGGSWVVLLYLAIFLGSLSSTGSCGSVEVGLCLGGAD